MMPVYVISLPEAHERRTAMRGRLDALGIPFEFFDAVDGRGHLVAGPPGVVIDRQSELPETQFACAVSHFHLAERIGAGSSDMALVLEDDAILSPQLPEILASAASVPFDILKLEGIARSNRPFLSRGAIGQSVLRVYSYVSMGTAGYVLTRKAAKRLLASIHVIDDAIDELLSKSKLDIVEVYPYPVAQDGSPTHQSRTPERPNFSRRMRNNFSRRARIIELYGWLDYLAMERQKLFSGVDR